MYWHIIYTQFNSNQPWFCLLDIGHRVVTVIIDTINLSDQLYSCSRNVLYILIETNHLESGNSGNGNILHLWISTRWKN